MRFGLAQGNRSYEIVRRILCISLFAIIMEYMCFIERKCAVGNG